MENVKTLKQYAKEAKQRMKSGFWQNYHKNLDSEVKKAEEVGVSTSKVIRYYTELIENDLKGKRQDDEFYAKVKELLDTEGEVSNAIGRLTDKDYYDTLSYDQKQRYTLDLSTKYVKAVERYYKEKEIVSITAKR